MSAVIFLCYNLEQNIYTYDECFSVFPCFSEDDSELVEM